MLPFGLCTEHHRLGALWKPPVKPSVRNTLPMARTAQVLQSGNTETLGPGAAFSPASGQCHSRGHLATSSKVRGAAGLVVLPPTPLISNKSPVWIFGPSESWAGRPEECGTAGATTHSGCGHKEKHRRRDLVQGKRQSVLHRVTLGWVPLPWAVEYEAWDLVVTQESTLRHRGCTGAVVAG